VERVGEEVGSTSPRASFLHRQVRSMTARSPGGMGRWTAADLADA
jgi:hypothetical protein